MSKITEKRKDIPFIITTSYLAAFLLIRLAVFLAGSAESEFAQAAKEGILPEVDFYIGRNIILFGYHIHHFYIGVLLICVAGWLSITENKRFLKKHLAIIYGAGLGLFFDEIGLLLTWGDYYSRLTYLLSLLLAGIFFNIIFFSDFWKSIKENIATSPTHSVMQSTFLKHNNFIKIADFISEKTGKTEKTSLFFTGSLYIAISFLIVIKPQAIRYWAALVFIIQGLAYFFKFLSESRG